jgi:hypothetical protein
MGFRFLQFIKVLIRFFASDPFKFPHKYTSLLRGVAFGRDVFIWQKKGGPEGLPGTFTNIIKPILASKAAVR